MAQNTGAAQVIFRDSRSANYRVAGLALVARALHRLVETGALADGQKCALLAASGRLVLDAHSRAALDRLVPDLDWFCADETGPAEAGDDAAIEESGAPLWIGEYLLIDPAAARAPSLAAARAALRAQEWPSLRKRLDSCARAIIAATGKPGDGVVSRAINRPISRAITRALLRLAPVRPIHATLACAAVAAAMIAAMVFGGHSGLMIGAVLFQFASILDGVDGEIARATHASSKFGASLDSAIDAATNLGFFAALAINLTRAGNGEAAVLAGLGIGALGSGLALLGVRALRSGAPLNFDGLKQPARASRSPLMRALAAIASRDFYALAMMVLVLAGQARLALALFALGAMAWLAYVLVMLARPR